MTQDPQHGPQWQARCITVMKPQAAITCLFVHLLGRHNWPPATPVCQPDITGAERQRQCLKRCYSALLRTIILRV